MEHASRVSNMGSQEMFTSTSSSPRASEACTLPHKNVELQGTSKHSTMTELRLHQHLQQDDAAKEEDVMRSFIMHRFLPAAKEVAAEHGSFIASLSSKDNSEAQSLPFPKKSQTTPKPHRIKSRAQQAPKNVTPSCPLLSPFQEDSMPHSRRSCGFFGRVLESTLFCTDCTVSASGCCTSRKKSWGPHPSNHLKIADGGISEMERPIARKEGAMRGVTKHQSGINVDVPILHPLRSPNSTNGQEVPWKHTINYDVSFSRRGCPGSDGCINAGCNPPLSQSGKVDLKGNQFENMKSTKNPHDDHVGARKFVSKALKEQTVQEGVAPCERESTCVCNHVRNLPSHDLAGENMPTSTLGGLETNGSKCAHDYALRNAWQNGDDGEPQFGDASSGLSSVKSKATFYTLDSSRSDCEVLGLEGDCVNDEVDFTDASSHFETPCASTSQNKLVLSNVCMANEKDVSGKMSSFSRRAGEGLRLETERKSPSKHDPSGHEQKHEPQQAQLQTRIFSRLRNRSLDSLSGLYLSKESSISPVSPAECHNNTPNASGWPFGISSCQSSRVEGSPYNIQQEKSSIEKNFIFPPLPPTPTEPWLRKAVTKNASKPPPLATLQQNEKWKSADFKSVNPDADFLLMNPDAEGRWEDVVKAVTKNASKPSPLATVQQKEKRKSADFKSANLDVDFISVTPDAERWDDVVKALTMNAFKASPLGTVQQKEKRKSVEFKSVNLDADFVSVNPDAITKNASKPSQLASLQQKEKRKSADFKSVNPDMGFMLLNPNAVTKNASKPSPLATLQQKEKRKSADFRSVNLDVERWEDMVTKNASKPLPLATLLLKETRKLADVKSVNPDADSRLVNPDAERKWEDVVKGSRVHRGHFRYSEELEILMLTSL